MKTFLQFFFWGSLVIASACKKSDSGGEITQGNQKKYAFKLSVNNPSDVHSDLRNTSLIPNISLLYVRIYNTVTGKLILSTDQTRLRGSDFGVIENLLSKGKYTAVLIGSQLPLQLHTSNNTNWSNAGFSTGAASSINDIFYKKIEFSISDRAVEQSVKLDRIIAGLNIVIEDAIPSNISKIEVFISGDKTTYQFSDDSRSGLVNRSLDFPVALIKHGSTNKTLTGITFGINSPTSVILKAYNNSNTVLFETSIADVTFQTNKTTKLSGKLFSNNTSFKVTLNTVWDTPLPVIQIN
jgi:hypothetical protein